VNLSLVVGDPRNLHCVTNESPEVIPDGIERRLSHHEGGIQLPSNSEKIASYDFPSVFGEHVSTGTRGMPMTIFFDTLHHPVFDQHIEQRIRASAPSSEKAFWPTNWCAESLEGLRRIQVGENGAFGIEREAAPGSVCFSTRPESIGRCTGSVCACTRYLPCHSRFPVTSTGSHAESAPACRTAPDAKFLAQVVTGEPSSQGRVRDGSTSVRCRAGSSSALSGHHAIRVDELEDARLLLDYRRLWRLLCCLAWLRAGQSP